MTMDHVVRYKPGEAIRWLESGAEESRRNALKTTKSVIRREGERSFGRDVKAVAGALWQAGSAAVADLAHKNATATQYALEGEAFEIIRGRDIRRVTYEEVRSMRMDGDKLVLVLDKGSVLVKPFAYIVAGKIKVPIGWSRNGVEVPYELIIEELSARCDLQVITE